MSKVLNSLEQLKFTFGKNIRKYRKGLDLTQEQLSQVTGLHSNYISDVERGIRNVSIVAMEKLANGLEIEVYKLLIKE